MSIITLEEAQRHFKSLESRGESVGYYANVFTDKARSIADFYKSGKMGSNQAISLLGGYVVARHKPNNVTPADWKKNVLKQSTVFSKKYEELVKFLASNPSSEALGAEVVRLRDSIVPKTIDTAGILKKASDDAALMESVSVYDPTEAIALVEIANRYLVKAGLKPVEIKVNLQVAS
jgi:hypothetical protein